MSLQFIQIEFGIRVAAVDLGDNIRQMGEHEIGAVGHSGREKQNLAVLKLDSKQPDALYNLGAIYANHDRFAEARQFWNDAVKYGKDTSSGQNAAVALTKLPR